MWTTPFTPEPLETLTPKIEALLKASGYTHKNTLLDNALAYAAKEIDWDNMHSGNTLYYKPDHLPAEKHLTDAQFDVLCYLAQTEKAAILLCETSDDYKKLGPYNYFIIKPMLQDAIDHALLPRAIEVAKKAGAEGDDDQHLLIDYVTKRFRIEFYGHTADGLFYDKTQEHNAFAIHYGQFPCKIETKDDAAVIRAMTGLGMFKRTDGYYQASYRLMTTMKKLYEQQGKLLDESSYHKSRIPWKERMDEERRDAALNRGQGL